MSDQPALIKQFWYSSNSWRVKPTDGPQPLPTIEGPVIPRFATWIPSRTTKKVIEYHTNVGHAKNAINQATATQYEIGPDGHPILSTRQYCWEDCAIFELVDGNWIVRFHRERGAPWHGKTEVTW